jgi:AcrR family transcriptional regulator
MNKQKTATAKSKAPSNDARSARLDVALPKPAPASTARKANSRRYMQRGIDTRERILKIAVNEFAQRGFEGTSTRTVAKLAGVPHTLVVYYFKNKDELWITAARELFQPFLDREFQYMEELKGKGAVERLKIIVAGFVRFSAEVPLFHRLMANEGRESSERLKFLISSFNARSSKLLAQLIAEAQADGEFIEGDPFLLLYEIVGAVTNPFALSAEFKIITGRSPFAPRAVEEHLNNIMRLFFPKR